MNPEGRLSPAEAAEVLKRSQPIAVERGGSPVPTGGSLVCAEVRTLIVLRDVDDPALGELIGEAACVVAPSAWTAYQVTGAPFFSLLMPGDATVTIEGVAWGADAVARSVARALSGDVSSEVPRLEVE